VAAKQNANQRCEHATMPGFLAQSSANAKAKETAPILSMHNMKQMKAMKAASSLLMNDYIFCIIQNCSY